MKQIIMTIDGNEVARIMDGTIKKKPIIDLPASVNLEYLYDSCFSGSDPLPTFEERFDLVKAGKYFCYQKPTLKLEAVDIEIADDDENDQTHKNDGGQFRSYFKDNENRLSEYGIDYNDFVTLSNKVSDELETVLKNIDPVGSILESFSRSGGAKGKNDFRNLLWWKIDMDEYSLKEQYCGFSKILLTASRAVITDIKSVAIGNGKPFPQVDEKTGNIHVDFDIFQWVKDYKDRPQQALRQAVLVGINDKRGSDPGPKLGCYGKTGEFTNKEMIIYSKDLCVPRKCYFPQLDDTTDKDYSIEALLYGLLKEVLEEDALSELLF